MLTVARSLNCLHSKARAAEIWKRVGDVCAVIWLYLTNCKLTALLFRKAKATKRYGDEDVWDYTFKPTMARPAMTIAMRTANVATSLAPTDGTRVRLDCRAGGSRSAAQECSKVPSLATRSSPGRRVCPARRSQSRSFPSPYGLEV